MGDDNVFDWLRGQNRAVQCQSVVKGRNGMWAEFYGFGIFVKLMRKLGKIAYLVFRMRN